MLELTTVIQCIFLGSLMTLRRLEHTKLTAETEHLIDTNLKKSVVLKWCIQVFKWVGDTLKTLRLQKVCIKKEWGLEHFSNIQDFFLCY